MYVIMVRGGGLVYERDFNKFLNRSSGLSKNDCKILGEYDKTKKFCELQVVQNNQLRGIVARLLSYHQRIDNLPLEDLEKIDSIVSKMKFLVKSKFITQEFSRYISGWRPNAAGQESCFEYKLKPEYLLRYKDSGCSNVSEFISLLEGGYQDRAFDASMISVRAKCGNNTGSRGRVTFKVNFNFDIVINEESIPEFDLAIEQGMNLVHFNNNGVCELSDVDSCESSDYEGLDGLTVKISHDNKITSEVLL